MTYPASIALEAQARLFEAMRSRIATLYDLDPDDRAVIDTALGETDLDRTLARLVRSLLDDEALADSLRSRLNDMRSRLDRLKERAERKRALVLHCMEECQLTLLVDAEFTASVKRKAPSVQVEDETLIPEWLFVPQPARLDRQALLATLKTGDLVPGARLASDGYSLAVRTR